MSALIFWLAYIGVTFVASVPLTRASVNLLGNHAYCHQEPRYGSGTKWRDSGYCREYDKKDCWRADGPLLSVRHAVVGSGAALVWPIALLGLLPLFAFKVNQRSIRPSLVSTEDIARMERELGIGAKP